MRKDLRKLCRENVRILRQTLKQYVDEEELKKVITEILDFYKSIERRYLSTYDIKELEKRVVDNSYTSRSCYFVEDESKPEDSQEVPKKEI